MITALNIANNFLEKGFQEKINISPMKLQKLIYILYKEYLKRTGSKLFTENFEVWQYGPVLPNVYNEFKGYKANPIKNYALNADSSVSKVNIVKGSHFEEIFNRVWNLYRLFSGVELSKFTHRENGALDKAKNNNNYVLNDRDIFMEEYYVE